MEYHLAQLLAKDNVWGHKVYETYLVNDNNKRVSVMRDIVPDVSFSVESGFGISIEAAIADFISKNETQVLREVFDGTFS